MSEDIKNPQEAPENDAHLQSEGSQKVVTDDSAANEEGASAEAPAEEEKIVFTKEEFDNHAAKVKAIAERRAKREIEAKYKAELDTKKQQEPAPTQYQQPYQQNQPPSPGHVWDELLGWIPQSVKEDSNSYAQAVTQAVTSLTQQPTYQQQPPQQPMQPSQPPPPTAPNPQYGGLSQNALEQFDELIVEDKATVMAAANFMTEAMANAAALHPQGLKMLVDQYKENPSDYVKLHQLSPDEQKFKMWKMQEEAAAKSAKKVSTSATPQVAPLESNGIVNKDYSDLSISERRKRELAKQWGD